jgi:hypothetical protein
MATGGDVMTMLCEGVEYVIYGDDYDSINWFDKPAAITKAQFSAGFAQYDAWKAAQDAKLAADKEAAQAKLEALGLTADDLNALGL